jgi:hypothetical protein
MPEKPINPVNESPPSAGHEPETPDVGEEFGDLEVGAEESERITGGSGPKTTPRNPWGR